ncbi:thioredoxin-like protein [Aspergillus japonicus CBS 114.51]|uniref:Glutathione S-transferase kappa n=1 Tax=Aspergillus japonicus CBS 114.51 TaxID=1448312 RepID=A0A8T8X1E9_ASPJA|nr:thioredoxin-like protein [Aspergillus japonicus CBS 114.51]RAH81967.1 thioredoxin-like protein [Aspergillus japonicus CBS 114.51]
MSSSPVIEYYFSFISLWSYIGSRRFQRLTQETNAKVILKPIDLMYIFSISGGLPVKQRSTQRQAYRLIEMERWRRIRDIPIVPQPKYYPADPSLAHRVLLAAIEESGHDDHSVQEYARLGLEAVWARELNIADQGTIVGIAKEAGLDGERLLERAKSESVLADQEAALTKEAEEKQYFGAPLYSLHGEPFWGQDRIEMLEDVIKSGREPIVIHDTE